MDGSGYWRYAYDIPKDRERVTRDGAKLFAKYLTRGSVLVGMCGADTLVDSFTNVNGSVLVEERSTLRDTCHASCASDRDPL